MARQPTNKAAAIDLRSAGTDDVALQIMVPRSLKHALSVKAAGEGTTQRTLVLKALRDAGFHVADDDLCDRRKGRS